MDRAAADAHGTEAEVQCPGCGITIRSYLGDQVVIQELRAQGWRPPLDPDTELVDELAERLRALQLRLGENTAGLIADGRRTIHLAPDERRELAEHLAVLVDELVERRAQRPGPGDHVLVTVDPTRNHGRASITRTMVPIRAAVGLLYAGESVDVVRDEYGLTAAEASVVAALADDFRDLAEDEEDVAGDTAPSPELDACRPVRVLVDGEEEVIRVHAVEPMSDAARAAFGEMVSVARRRIAATNPHLGVIQELLAADRIARWCIPDGPHTRFGQHDGAAVRDRLRAAVRAARDALSNHNQDGDATNV